MKELTDKIKNSFHKAMKGEEDIKIVIWAWGAVAYLVGFFIIDKLIKAVDLRFFDIVISFTATAYFIWHIYILRKCAPKKPKLSKEEKQKLKAEARKDLGKKFMRKLFLQEPLTKTDPIFLTMVIDLFFVANFGGYIF